MCDRALYCFLLGLILFVGGCLSNNIASVAYPPFSFEQKKAIDFDVAKLEFVSEFTPYFTRPNVEHLFVVPPEKALRLWFTSRLKSASVSRGESILKMVIKDASVEGDSAYSEQHSHLVDTYKANVHVLFELYKDDASVFPETEVNIYANRSLSMPADVSAAKREAAFYNMVKQLMDDFDKQVVRNFGNYFAKYITKEDDSVPSKEEPVGQGI
jgi:hypothetical protein